MAIENTCHVPECFNPVGPDGTLCELHEELHDQGAIDAAEDQRLHDEDVAHTGGHDDGD